MIVCKEGVGSIRDMLIKQKMAYRVSIGTHKSPMSTLDLQMSSQKSKILKIIAAMLAARSHPLGATQWTPRCVGSIVIFQHVVII